MPARPEGKPRPEPVPLTAEDEAAVGEFYRFLAHDEETEIRLINAKHRYAKPPILFLHSEEEFLEAVRAHNGVREIYAGWAERTPGGTHTSDVRRATLLPLDLDTQEGAEATTEDVLALAEALRVWAEDEGFETPSRVLSGNGVHLYWAIPPVEFATTEERTRFSRGLAAFVDFLNAQFADVMPGVEVDPQVKDLARLMRVPGTLNLKNPAVPKLTAVVDPLERREDPQLLEYVLGLAGQRELRAR
ncbi:MAG TPA: hypothetical protein VNZ52_08685 [Candidatus Thermoplasmatota archaeon]|nr:hypothetical protein [Candidatus Thermoplasmatota archaeon]